MTASFDIVLPPGYRAGDVLRFHSRDTENVAEEVTPALLRKGVMLDGVPVVLTAPLCDGPGPIVCQGHADGELTPTLRQHIHDALLNILGLRIDPGPFLDAVRADPLMGPLARRRPGLRIVQSATVFEALTWAIIGQQINLSFAIALRRTFILQAGRQHSSGLWCYPEASDAARLTSDALTSRKFSRAKADTLLRFAGLVASGALDLAPGPDNTIEHIGQRLLAIKGIGPWTVNYGLLRGYGHADCSLHGDVAVRAALQRMLGGDARPDVARAEQLLQRYQPHRTMAAAHLWASLAPEE
ncbi:DNA-3-methyladenine glycosylase family protein [Pseudoduganella plicata]|uniref:DNA-3-methyladenine glycosylase II n=1 Tax=Pseudoduganella plicata TaxID=321984 RepID=A0A4P7BEF3_9BURK|nr:DNA-3-methyladenine glycosylase 2 [Pseudoduganella plicata]QBQ36492.1 DNA-3-methyladenine glycosylase 2 [Pseudoduganella plicata]GGY74928.1 DNA-3-methyladenine glycosylase [Pseudoduganella plicata]